MERERVVGFIPVLNEVGTAAAVVESALLTGSLDHVLVVDDGSTDGTLETLERTRARFPQLDVAVRRGARGFGNALLFGFAEALRQYEFDRLVELDADLSHDPRRIPELLKVPADLVIGSRYVDGGRVVNWPLSRRIISLAANSCAQHLLGIRVKDVTSGFRVYTRNLLETIVREAACGGYELQVEAVWLALQRGFTVGEEPITFIERKQGRSKLATGEEAWRFARFVIQRSLQRPLSGES